MALARLTVGRNLTNYLRPVSVGAGRRCISTSKKNGETATVSEKLPSHVPANANGRNAELDASIANAAKRKWMSLGFHNTSEEEDYGNAHLLFFAVVSCCVVGSWFYHTYGPDRKLKDWAQREAYLVIQEREAKGLPLIDPNMVDPAKMVLPSEEELGDTEIII